MHIHRQIIVTGRVQGVYFRQSAMDEALRLGLNANARNLSSGAVELHAEGPQEAVEGFTAWCRRGPVLARVDSCRHTDGALQGLDGVKILR